MTDHITDTYDLVITIIQHGNVQISNVVAPSQVYSGEDFIISYDATNNSDADDCWGHIMDTGGGSEIPNSRWEQNLANGGAYHSEVTVPGRDSDLNATIEVGYVTA